MLYSFWFDKTRIPRENLLNRHANVAPDGTYSSPFDSNVKRFAAMVGMRTHKTSNFSNNVSG